MNKSLATIVTAGAIALGGLSISSQPSQAQSTTFFCGKKSDGTFVTVANTRRGAVEVIRWVSDHFSGSGYTPQVRCQEVSSRFQSYHSRGMLNFITAGYLNGQPAVCVGDGTSPCSSDRLLFTLKPGQNAARTIQQLFNIRAGASGPLFESSGQTSGSSESGIIDMNKFLDEAPLMEGSGGTTSGETTPPAVSEPSLPTEGGTVW